MNDQTSGFADMFLSATLTEANTRRPPIPGGTVLRGVLGKPTTRTATGKKETNMGVQYNFCEIPVELDLTQKPDIQQIVGADKVTLTYSFRLDILPDGRGLDMSPGKNNGLRQLREALDMNRPGEPFQILAVEGRIALFHTKIEVVDNEPYDRIASIAHV